MNVRPVPQYPWGWKSMWVIAMFDLPTDTPAARKAYATFRKRLLEDGFAMMQYSVYARHCASIENADAHVRQMGAQLPPEGEVRFLVITDRQYGRIHIFTGKKRRPTPPSPAQLEFFDSQSERRGLFFNALEKSECSKPRDDRKPQLARTEYAKRK